MPDVHFPISNLVLQVVAVHFINQGEIVEGRI